MDINLSYHQDMWNNFHKFKLPPDAIKIIKILTTAAQDIGIERIALVGGFVRDCLLKGNNINTNIDIVDIDIVVEGSASELARCLKKFIPLGHKTKYIFHESYDTVKFTFDKIFIDLTSSRKEIYPEPGENPRVTNTSLIEDLYRRDFSINAIALELYNGEIIDPFNGKNALKNREILFLHSKSVADDPSRVIRAARYAARLDFHLSEDSLLQIQQTLKNWPWNWKLGELPDQAPPALAIRMRMELELLLEKEPWEIAIRKLQEWGGLALLDKDLQDDSELIEKLKKASALSIPKLTVLVSTAKEFTNLAKRLEIPQQQQRFLIESNKLTNTLLSITSKKESENFNASRWCHIIETQVVHTESIAISICNCNPISEILMKWWDSWRHVKSPISAKELINKGWEKGPKLGSHLRQLRYKQIDILSKT